MKPPPNIARQSGVALIVGLAMLLMLTLLSVSSMNMATMELRISSNTQNQHHCFQGAEQGLERVVDSRPGEPVAINYNNLGVQDLGQDLPVGDPLNPVAVDLQTQFVQRVSGVGCSGNEVNSFACAHFQITANADHGPSNASCNHVQGVYKLIPK